MTVRVECPAPGCSEQVDRGGMYSTTRSRWCDAFAIHTHSHCDGWFDLVGMEVQHLRCGCYCHRRASEGEREGEGP